MKHRALRKRYGRSRKWGPPVGAWGSRRLLKGGWQTYRGYTLDTWKAPQVQHSRATWEICIYGSAPGVMEGNEYGKTREEAVAKAKRLVDAMIDSRGIRNRLERGYD